ncbi:MAG: SDR family NAD(P)-dependent oxidoreductase [Acidimicrobiales bacterium]
MGFLDGRTALITGGTRGIGRAIATVLHAEGANVVINGRSEDKGRQAIDELGGGDRIHFLAGDVQLQSVCEGLVAGTIERYGAIDILVNNAGGVGNPAIVAELGDEEWQSILNWNLNHPFWCSRAALKAMIPRQWGRIINMSSMYGKTALPGVAPYITTKHALNGLTKVIAQEVGTLGITCNALCPGLIITDIVESTAPMSAAAIGMNYDDYINMIVAGSAIKKPNTVEQVAAVALLLCSEAGAGITGSMINIDGGSSPY